MLEQYENNLNTGTMSKLKKEAGGAIKTYIFANVLWFFIESTIKIVFFTCNAIGFVFIKGIEKIIPQSKEEIESKQREQIFLLEQQTALKEEEDKFTNAYKDWQSQKLLKDK